MRAVSARTSASNGGPVAGMISDATRGAIQPIISTGMPLPLSCKSHFIPVAGLDPAIHVCLVAKPDRLEDVDGRVKPGRGDILRSWEGSMTARVAMVSLE